MAIQEDFFDILYELHSVQRSHVFINKIAHQVQLRYHGLPRAFVSSFIRLCPICNLKHVQHSQPLLNPIRSDDFRARFQIDLIDMRHRPCKRDRPAREFKWIAKWMLWTTFPNFM